MKIGFENSIRTLSFLCHLLDIKITWINLFQKYVIVFQNKE